MATRNEAYVDTSALIAFYDDSDKHHSLFRQLFASPPPLTTTPLVVGEGHSWCLRRYDRAQAARFLDLVYTLTMLTILSVGAKEQASAIIYLRRFKDQDLTLTDALGLHCMKIRKTNICWSTDFHLGLTGVPLAIHRQ
jgi:predicted nucleic acid-binding protein